MTDAIPIPADICWAALAEYDGLMLAVEWVRGKPAPVWAEQVATLAWMRAALREDLPTFFGSAFRVKLSEQHTPQWVSFMPITDGMWTVSPFDTKH